MRSAARLVAAAAAAALLAAPAGSAAAYRWYTPGGALAAAKRYGITFADGSHARPIDGFCNGRGPSRGSLARPTYRAFECTLVVGTLASNSWDDVVMRTTTTTRLNVTLLRRA